MTRPCLLSVLRACAGTETRPDPLPAAPGQALPLGQPHPPGTGEVPEGGARRWDPVVSLVLGIRLSPPSAAWGHQVLRTTSPRACTQGPPLQVLGCGRLSLPWVPPTLPTDICSSPFLTPAVAGDGEAFQQVFRAGLAGTVLVAHFREGGPAFPDPSRAQTRAWLGRRAKTMRTPPCLREPSVGRRGGTLPREGGRDMAKNEAASPGRLPGGGSLFPGLRAAPTR